MQQYGVLYKGRGWLTPSMGPGKFFNVTMQPSFPFRTKEGAEQIGKDWASGVKPYDSVRIVGSDERPYPLP